MNLNTDKFSMLHICYKNLIFKKQENKKNLVVLDSKYKKLIKRDGKFLLHKYKDIIDDDIWIIGRKYKNYTTHCVENNSLHLPIFLSSVYFNKTKIRKVKTKTVIKHDNSTEFVHRRKFLMNLKHCLEKACVHQTEHINHMIKNSISLDIEYSNDIYDDFSKFPISCNSSCLFMIGVSDYQKNYINFTASKLDKTNEAFIIQQYLNHIYNLISKNGKMIIFHWSPADKSVIEKTLLHHPTLNTFYKHHILNNIIYIDLMHIVKSTIPLESYALKYVLEKLLCIKYETQCKNGLDAMCSIIYNNIEIKNNDKKLTDFETTNDIVLYNRLDTIYLYDIIKKFTHPKISN